MTALVLGLSAAPGVQAQSAVNCFDLATFSEVPATIVGTNSVMGLLERTSLLDELGGVLAATATGGRVVLVAGEAGIGKSVMVRRCCRARTRPGMCGCWSTRWWCPGR